MTSSQPQQPVGGRLADRLSALRAGTGTARLLAVSLLRRLDRYDRALYRSVARNAPAAAGRAVESGV